MYFFLTDRLLRLKLIVETYVQDIEYIKDGINILEGARIKFTLNSN